jgi:hypothetical protein
LSKAHDHKNSDDSEASLVLQHTFMAKMPVDFAGPSYFGGKDDSLILCAGKGIYSAYTYGNNICN